MFACTGGAHHGAADTADERTLAGTTLAVDHTAQNGATNRTNDCSGNDIASICPAICHVLGITLAERLAPGFGRIRTFSRIARPAYLLGPGPQRRDQQLPAAGELQLSFGETLVLGSGDAGALGAVLYELEHLVQLPQADSAQLVALIEGAAGELADVVAAPVGLVVAVAGGGRDPQAGWV